MNPAQRERLLIAGMLLMGVLLAGLSLGQYLGARSDARAAAQAVAEVRRLSGRIEQHRRQPTLEGAGDTARTNVHSMLRTSANTADLDVNALGSISLDNRPLARQGAASLYQKRTVRTTLEEVPLPKLLRMLHHVVSEYPQIHVESLTLTSSNDRSASDTWNVSDLVLSYLTYDPEASTSR